MDLNGYRDEAGAFLAALGKDNSGIQEKVDLLEAELELLKKVKEEPDRLRHQIYDMLFILFEIASESGFDLNGEWEIGRKRKSEKYLSC